MPVVRLDGVSFSYRDSVPVLIDVTLELHEGWTAVVGPNGAGKTTLLRLLAGELAPESGRIALEPAAAHRVWCRQTAEDCTDEIRAFAAAADGVARRLHGTLALATARLERWPDLSPGERRRWQIGAALATEPDLLLLDEPTDHLDGHAREILLAALASFRGVGVVVSHDRALLAALSDATARIADAGVELRRTGFDEARRAWQMENAARRDARTKIRREEKRLRRRLGTRRSDLQSAEASIRTKKRAKGRRDSDARTMAARNRARAGAARVGRDVAVLRDRVARTGKALDDTRFEKEKGGRIDFAFEPAPDEHLTGLERAELRAGDVCVLRDVSVQVSRGTRAWLRGPNGAGKTTLFRALVRGLSLADERVLVLPQELAPEDVDALLARIRSLGPEARGRLLAMTATLGADPERLLETERPSPGEARKLWIASGLARGVAACFLDEPTNHLDLPAIERLEAALVAYPGAVVLVSHDTALAERCTDVTWHVADGGVVVC